MKGRQRQDRGHPWPLKSKLVVQMTYTPPIAPNKTCERLREVAKLRCLPYLVSQETIAPLHDAIAFVLVGSVATGWCQKNSDIDIALVCEEDAWDVISKGPSWSEGRPTEVMIDGIQLHFYGMTYSQIRERLQELDDAYLYVYTQAIVLADSQDGYTRRLSDLLATAPGIRKQRVEGKLDMLLRRSGAVRSCVQDGDVVAIAKISLEVITLCLKVTALLDDVPFDPRKRLFKTALSGTLGLRLAADVRQLFHELGLLSDIGDECDRSVFGLPGRLQIVTDILCDAARKQGFVVGLDKPDRRHIEK